MSEKLKTSGEELENIQKSEEMDYPEFQGKKDKIEEIEKIIPTVEETREQVLNAISSKKNKEKTSNSPENEAFKSERREMARQENIPDDVDEISDWIEEFDKLPAKYGIKDKDHQEGYDESAHIALSKKHGEDMLPEDRESAYKKLEQWYDDGPGHLVPLSATNLMINAIKNSQYVEKNKEMREEEKGESIRIEEEAAKSFEKKAVESMDDMDSAELKEYAYKVQSVANHYGTLADLTEKWSEANDDKERANIKERANQLIKMWGFKESFPCYDAEQKSKDFEKKFSATYRESQKIEKTGKGSESKPYEVREAETLKYLYKVAAKQKEKVTGFGNKRRLKKDEKLILPENFGELVERSDIYDADRLRGMIAEYVGMQK